MPEDASKASKAPEHLSELYRLAQVLTKDPSQALRLVKATYHRAAAMGVAPEDRLGLFRLLAEYADADAESPPSHPSKPWSSPTDLPVDFRAHLTVRLLDRLLPIVFANLPGEARLLLVLGGVEGCSCADIGRVIDLPADEACRRLNRTRTALRRHLLHNARPAEQTLLENIPDEMLDAALRRLADTAFDDPPVDLQVTAGTVPGQATAAPASDRPHETRGGPFQRLRRTFLTLLIIGVAGTAGYFAQQLLMPSPETNVLTLSVRPPATARLTLQTDSRAAAEAFFRDRLGRRLTVPTIEQATLQDVSIVEMAAGVPVPVLRYEDVATGAPLTIYAYSYALLDAHEEQLRLNTNILRTIADAQKIETREMNRQTVLVWRYRDDIFVAVTPADPDALRERIF